MIPSTPLKDTELIDCARANSDEGIEVAAERCGYGQDLETFETDLKQACYAIGVKYDSFDDIVKSTTDYHKDAGIVIAPETPTEL